MTTYYRWTTTICTVFIHATVYYRWLLLYSIHTTWLLNTSDYHCTVSIFCRILLVTNTVLYSYTITAGDWQLWYCEISIKNKNSSSLSSTAGLFHPMCTMFHPNIFYVFLKNIPHFCVPIDLQFCVPGPNFFAFYYFIHSRDFLYFLCPNFVYIIHG